MAADVFPAETKVIGILATLSAWQKTALKLCTLGNDIRSTFCQDKKTTTE